MLKQQLKALFFITLLFAGGHAESDSGWWPKTWG